MRSQSIFPTSNADGQLHGLYSDTNSSQQLWRRKRFTSMSLEKVLGPKVTGIDLSTLESYNLILSQWAALWLSDLSIFTYLIRLLKDHPKVLPVFDIDTLTDPVLKVCMFLFTYPNLISELIVYVLGNQRARDKNEWSGRRRAEKSPSLDIPNNAFNY